MPPSSVLVARHGRSTWNAAGRWQGQADPPLAPLGRAQARAAADALAGVDVVAASDLARAHETASLIAEALGRGPVVVSANLREIDAGPWTGLTRAEIEASWPGYLASGRRPPGFERWEDVAARARSGLIELHRDHPGASVVAITHAGVIRALERVCGVDDGVVPNLGGRHLQVSGTALALGPRVLLIDPETVTVTAPSAL